MQMTFPHTMTSASLEGIFKGEIVCHLVPGTGLQWREGSHNKCTVEDTVESSCGIADHT